MSDNEKDKVEAEDNDTSTEAVLIEDAEVVEEVAAEEVSPEDASEPEPTVDDGTAEVAVDPSEMQPVAKPGNPLIPMVFGGIVAGAIGFGAATYLGFGTGQDGDALAELSAKVDSQTAEIEALTNEVSRVEGLTDTSGLSTSLQTSLAEFETNNAIAIADFDARIGGFSETLSAIEQRVLDLEKRLMEATFSDEAIAAYEAEMSSLFEAVAQHRADIEAMAAEAREMETAARQETVRSEGASWVTEVSIAIADGSSFAAPLDAIKVEGMAIPVALNAAAGEGVATLAELVADFPDAARAALTAVRSEEGDETGGGGLLTFLQNQVGARSVSPKEGDSADAILSRAEAEAQSGNLSAAIAELGSLPEVGQAAMAGWMMQAQERLDVVAALDALRETVLNK